MRASFPILFVISTMLVLPSMDALAQAPDSVSFQGALSDSLGTPVDSSGVMMTFKLYKGGVEIWSETQSVDVEDGVFNVLLGATTPLDTVTFNRAIDLGVTLVGEGEEMTPQIPLAAAAYAKALPGMYTAYSEVTGLNSYKSYNVIGGASNNGLEPGESITGATISGGGGLWDPACCEEFAVPNIVESPFGTIGGGYGNRVTGAQGTISGGDFNTATSGAAVGGGSDNAATGTLSAIGGGILNRATGDGATVPGGSENHARGLGSLAAGTKARAAHDGTFVWSDGTAAASGVDSLVTSFPNQFLAKASGGVTFFSNADTTTGVHLAPAAGAWASVSDRNVKTGFGQPDPRHVLERLSTVPIQTWRYQGQDESVTHMGPIAQDFYDAFGLGIDNRHIVTVDADGVALSAIQGLYAMLLEQRATVELLRAENARLVSEVERLADR